MSTDPNDILSCRFAQHYGRRFIVSIVEDDMNSTPWDDLSDDGESPVRTVRHKFDKRPGERLLYEDLDCVRLYDMQGMQRRVREEGWCLPPAEMAELEAHTAQAFNRAPTKREIAAHAVERNYQRMRAWCLDQWRYVGVEVVDECDPGARAFLYGLESDETEYLDNITLELCAEADSRDDLERQVQRVLGAPALVFEDE